jgi:arsenate reductase (thioredoxin)
MNVLFVCVQNAGRSQIAEALYAQAGGNARSAGTAPAERVHPEVVEVMQEVGVDLADRVPHGLDDSDVEWADVVVTMGCGDACPVLPGKRYLDWELPDPSGRPLEDVRALREEIGRRVNELVSAGEKVVTGPRQPPS